uniref:Uncharacterized protein n=1 Tax=Rhipicephalus zambeziensis TaxID=60191 RepID=A0A224Y860_9ACAR
MEATVRYFYLVCIAALLTNIIKGTTGAKLKHPVGGQPQNKVRSLAQRCNYRAQCAAPLICKKSGTTCTCSPPRNFAQLCPK